MAWVHAFQIRLPFFGPPERRTRAQIDRDLDDEIDFHLDMKTRELVEEGHAFEDACRLARAQFGRVEDIKERCRGIAMEDRIMLQKIHVGFTIVLALTLVVCIWVGFRRIAMERESSMQSRLLAETARVQAEEAHAQALAVRNFLTELLAAADPSAAGTPEAMRQALDNAAERIDRDFADNPTVAAELRRTIEQAKQKLNEETND